MNSSDFLTQGILYSYVAILGLCTGSFLNVLILRGLSGEPVVFARSKCPKCQNTLKWYMNIPLLSFLFLKGKCAYCKKPISVQYPLLEALNAVMYVLAYAAFGPTIKFLFTCAFLTLCLAMIVTDIKKTVIVDSHAYFLAVFGFFASFYALFYTNPKTALIGSIGGFILFELFARSSVLFCNQRMFGFGDSLIIMALGMFFGLKRLLIVTALGILIQGICTLPFIIKSVFKQNKKKLATAYILTFISIISVFLTANWEGTKRFIYATGLTLVLLWSLVQIIKEIAEKRKEIDKNDTEDEKFEKTPFFAVPFGPALLVSSIICLFYVDKIKNIIIDFFF